MVGNVIAKHQEVTAVIGRNIEFTCGALAELQSRGVRIPEEMSIVSFTDSYVAEGIWPRLTALRTPNHEAAEQAMETALLMLRGESVQTDPIEFPVVLIPGETTAPPSNIVR